MGNYNIQILPIKLNAPVIPEDFGKFSVADLILNNMIVENGDIIAVTSKIVSILEGRCVKVAEIIPSPKTKRLARHYNVNPAKLELILREGKPICVVPMKKLMTNRKINELIFSLSVNGLIDQDKSSLMNQYSYIWFSRVGCHLADSAGIDKSNIPGDYVSLLPKDPKESAQKIRTEIMSKVQKKVAIVITDTMGGSLSFQGHWDTPLAYAGIDPLEKKVGEKDVFGLVGTGGRGNYVVPIAAIAGLVMGSCNECTPIAIIRNLQYKSEMADEVDRGQDLTDIEVPVKERLRIMWWTLVTTIGYFLRSTVYR
ncbi:MAG: hypothetical protein A2504_09435 [Bdellovibrionales bacterium RIFOXYD12_FULL_39_22]|nr:MAG: hypothetical protein A2385_12925 [Bdellovibrionales bacterium RIFOXYB1_FULL_39_21]OFZ40948.1 MAG: hypothetical protein A2485_16435 [Bdellovibrionales bacterium RIFOXYC12_FULL_39_17]OFZ44776.1 MAG: hypothetical protein A2404_09725 [Bdellovibrionales bacterium RIFOXYC1_FULL_39_130]OFZ73257.1 MAG: hypothetical protein A2451_07690 [Bdellovibrionales bacterium RIFOXYC2_FULL_39_8]OFZ74241.1 MAG: hypothetical protein A2560_16690 [Bdellovibrionales bacterium RIFOXYD1_FULL_39_84]OFZ92105.1 MAG: